MPVYGSCKGIKLKKYIVILGNEQNLHAFDISDPGVELKDKFLQSDG